MLKDADEHASQAAGEPSGAGGIRALRCVSKLFIWAQRASVSFVSP